MDKLNNPLARGASYLLIYLMALQPLNPSIAAGITAAVSGIQIQNGSVPVVNIATPNEKGISHNLYKDFNVNSSGAVLNNSTAAGKSQLAGQINANNNLKGKAAELIINEVSGNNKSELTGKMEVFGSKSNVIIANPNGITCDGCGFINSSNVTLTTGRPVLNQKGEIDSIDIKKGGVIIGSRGMDASSADYIDILSRTAELNGKINAKNLSFVQGANHVNLKDGSIRNINGEGARPQLALDTKALGGMYAQRIRLIATEAGIGVNSSNLTSTKMGISLDVKGKIILGNTSAVGDLYVSAPDGAISAGNQVTSGGDTTLSVNNFVNQGKVVSGKNLKLFGVNIKNTGSNSLLQAGENIWIQKDAYGNKSNIVENKSAKITTTRGDLIIKSERLDNSVSDIGLSANTIIPSESVVENDVFGWRPFVIPSGELGTEHVVGEFSSTEPKKWFGAVDFNNLSSVNISQTRMKYGLSGSVPEISSGKNLYINATELNNDAGIIKSTKNSILTGSRLNNISYEQGLLKKHYLFQKREYLDKLRPEVAGHYPNGPHKKTIVPFSHEGEAFSWEAEGGLLATVKAGEDIVADFKESINIKKNLPYDTTKISEVTAKDSPENFSGRNVLLNSSKISLASSTIKALNLLAVNTDSITSIENTKLNSAGSISITSVKDITLRQNTITGKDVSFYSRTGNVNLNSSDKTNFFDTSGKRLLNTINSTGDLDISAGGMVSVHNTSVNQNNNVQINAGRDISILSSDFSLENNRLGKKSAPKVLSSDEFQKSSLLSSKDSVTLNAGGNINITGGGIKADKNVNLLAGKNIVLVNRILPDIWYDTLGSARLPELMTKITAGQNLLITAGRDISATGSRIYASGNGTLLSGNNLNLKNVGYSNLDKDNDNNLDERNLVVMLQTGKALTVSSNGEFISRGSEFVSGGDMTVSSGKKMEFTAVKNHIYRERSDGYSEEATQQNNKLNSRGLLTILSNSSILFQATSLITRKTLDVAAKGGFLYAQAMEEFSTYEKTTTKRKWYGKKTTIRQTSQKIKNKVTEFTADGNINLLSRDDSTYQASKIDAGKNAKLVSTKGKIIFEAVKNTTFEQRISNSKGFWIKNSDQGFTEGKWIMPSVYTGGALTVNASNGISADIKAQNSKNLKEAVTLLGNTKGTEWLKGLNSRQDVKWNIVQDAYDTWNYKTQSLNPVVSAVIAVAVAAVTAGTGIAAAAGQAVADAASLSTATAAGSAAYGMGAAGMSALASQAAVALVENQGNISKTLQTLGNSSSVKALASSIIVGGTLAGFDQALFGINVTPTSAKLPVLSNGDWNKVIQRVAGQAVLSSSIGNIVSGGSFREQLTNALLSNISGQINAEGAKIVGDNGIILNKGGKALSHAVVAGIAAEIGRGNVKGAMAGSLAAQIAGVLINDNLVKTAHWQERDAQISRVAGALAGALSTGVASGVNSGADAAEIVERFNRQLHLDEIKAIKELAKGDPVAEEKLLAASCRQVSCFYQLALDSEERAYYEALMAKYPDTLTEDALLSNLWIKKVKERTSNYPAYLESYLEQMFTYTPADKLSDTEIFIKNQWVSEASKTFGIDKTTLTAFQSLLATGSIVLASKGYGGIANPSKKGVLVGANFAQDKIRADRKFSKEGQALYSGMAGSPINSVDDLSNALKNGSIKPSQIPLDYVSMNGTRLILNTRTSTALEQASIPRSQWYGNDRTGQEAYPGKTFIQLAEDQLKNNKLPPTGAEKLK